MGTILYENVTRRPFTELDTWMILMDHWSEYVLWCQTLTVGVLLNLIGFIVEVVGNNPRGPAAFTATLCGLGMVITVRFAIATTVQAGKFQTLRTKQFMDAYCVEATGKLQTKWSKWLEERTERARANSVLSVSSVNSGGAS